MENEVPNEMETDLRNLLNNAKFKIAIEKLLDRVQDIDEFMFCTVSKDGNVNWENYNMSDASAVFLLERIKLDILNGSVEDIPD